MTNVYYKQYRHRMNYWPYLSIVCCSHLISLCLRQSVSKHSTSNDKGAAPILWRPKWNRFRWNYINIASAGIIKALKCTDRFLSSFRTSICAMSVISTGNRPEAHLSRYHLVSLALFASCSRNYCYSFLTFFPFSLHEGNGMRSPRIELFTRVHGRTKRNRKSEWERALCLLRFLRVSASFIIWCNW